MSSTGPPNIPELIKFALLIGGTFFVTAAIGAFVTGSKPHSVLAEEERKEREKQRQEQQQRRRYPDEHEYDDMPSASRGYEQEEQTELSPEDEKQLFTLFQTGMYLEQIYQFETAAHYFQILLDFGNKMRTPLVDRIMPQFLMHAFSCLVDVGKIEEAKAVVQAYPRPLSLEDRLKVTESFISLLIAEEDPTTVTLIETAINGIAEIKGIECPEIPKFLCMLSTFLRHVGSYKDATEESLKAIAICRKLQPEGQTFSKELLFAYLTLQAAYITQGYVAKAEEIQKEIENECDPFDITFNWHLTHLAMIFVESDYDTFAEKYWKIVLDRFEQLDRFKDYPKTEFNRIVSLIANSMNELSVVYFNQRKFKSYEPLAKQIRANGWFLNTGSKYFETKKVSWVHEFDEQRDDWSGRFALVLKLKHVAPGSVVSTTIDFTGKDEEFDTIVGHPHSLLVRSPPRKDFECKLYTITIRLYSNRKKEELLSTHLQTVQCGFDTRGVNTLQEFMSKFMQPDRGSQQAPPPPSSSPPSIESGPESNSDSIAQEIDEDKLRNRNPGLERRVNVSESKNANLEAFTRRVESQSFAEEVVDDDQFD